MTKSGDTGDASVSIRFTDGRIDGTRRLDRVLGGEFDVVP